jgi:hypothetical protein
MLDRKPRLALLVSFGAATALVGYLLPWLAHPAAGLTLIGLEVGEWIKFLPPFRTGTAPLPREVFYLPPLTLGAMLVLMTADWPDRGARTWLMRGCGVLISLLALPQPEVIRDEPAAAWWLRLALIGLVALIGLMLSVWPGKKRRLLWIGAAVGMLGALVPTVGFYLIRPIVAEALRAPAGVGIGVWVSAAGQLALAAACLIALRSRGVAADGDHAREIDDGVLIDNG